MQHYFPAAKVFDRHRFVTFNPRQFYAWKFGPDFKFRLCFRLIDKRECYKNGKHKKNKIFHKSPINQIKDQKSRHRVLRAGKKQKVKLHIKMQNVQNYYFYNC